MADAKITDLSALAGASIADGDVVAIVDVSDTSMAASGTTKKSSAVDLLAYVRGKERAYNASVSTPAAGFAADTYLIGSSLAIPAGGLQAKTLYRCSFDVTKTGAGTAAPVITPRIGTAGTIADTARGAITFPAQTGVIDNGLFEVVVVFRTVGSGTSAVTQTRGRLTHNLSVTGLSVGVGPIAVATAGGFDSTTATFIGLSVNGGTSAAWTITLVQAELINLA